MTVLKYGAALICMGCLVWAVSVRASVSAGPEAVFRAYADAVNAGSIDRVRSLLSPGIARPPFSRCPPTLGDFDCAVSYLNETAVKRHSIITTLSVRVQGDIALAKLELRNDATKAAGLDRISGTDRLRVRDGKIVEFAFLRDEQDPQTMKFFQFMMAHGGPPGRR